MQNNIYQEYALAKSEIAILESKIDDLKVKILNDLTDKDITKQETEFGVFIKASKKKYIYSRKLQKEEENLKIAKLDEQESGKAKVEISEYITLKPNASDQTLT